MKMIKAYGLVTLLVFAFVAPSILHGAPKPFKEPLFLISESCKTLAVELRGGTIKTLEGDQISTICEPKKNSLVLKCSFYDVNNKLIAERTMMGGSEGLEAVVITEGGSDNFILNLTSQKFYAESNLYLADGLLRGKKICVGSFVFRSLIKGK